MTYRIDYLPLFKDAVYEYNSSIESRAFKFRFSLNSRTKIYHLDISTVDGTVVVQGIPLLPFNTLLDTLSLEEYGLTGYIILVPVSMEQDFSNTPSEALSEYYSLLYVYEVV